MKDSEDKIIDKTGWNYTIIENQIIETENLDIYEKMFYIVLKRFANIQTGEAFPGVKRVASFAGMSERKARSVIGSLADKRLINVEYRLNKTSIYTLLPTNAQGAGGAYDAGGHAHGAGGVVHTVQVGGAHGADELKKQELKKLELKKDNNIVEKLDNAPYKEVIEYLNMKTGKNFRHTTKAHKIYIHARHAEGATLDDFKRVIDTKTSQWLNDTKHDMYLRPETLFGTKFESYLNERGGNNNASNVGNTQKPRITKTYEDGINF